MGEMVYDRHFLKCKIYFYLIIYDYFIFIYLCMYLLIIVNGIIKA